MATVRPFKSESSEIELTVHHYGPNKVDDPDHSTSIQLRRIVTTGPGNGFMTGQLLTLESDGELDLLILALQQAKETADLNKKEEQR